MDTSTVARPYPARLLDRAFFYLRLGLVLLMLGLAPSAFGQAHIGQSLLDEIATLNPFETTTVIVTFDQDGPLAGAQLNLLRSVGVTRGRFFETLPIAAVLATRAQVGLLAALPGVRSLWANEPLTYYNDTGTAITGVDRLRDDPNLRTAAGLPFSGQGVTVVVNDSGIDATHADLAYGTHVVENVQGVTNLNAVSSLLPVTYVEGTPNTDTNSGHGTHCAGTVGATGARSGGLYEGVAPGADLVGYGSGAVLFILDGIGGFDYAVTHQFTFENPIRVITNSWGSTAAFDPENPINHASYAAYKRGITVLFAAGNAGSGADTHNPYAIAPWVISVGAGDKAGLLADFSSRGVDGQTFSFQTTDGESWTARNEITVTAPGVDIVSTRAVTNGTANGGDGDVDVIPPAYLPFYTMISGTSMATPHVAGIVALMLEANPELSPDEVKQLLRETATSMAGRAPWEAGTGYVNAYAAVTAALGRNARPYGAMVNALRTFHAEALVESAGEEAFSLAFSPVGETETLSFDVAADISRVAARAVVEDNLVALVLTDPDGERYGSAISIPVLGGTIAVSAPGKPGSWTLTISGIGSVSGVPTDPLGITNGTSLPGQVDGTLSFQRTSGFSGLGDVAGHPAEVFVQYAVANRLMDGTQNGFKPTRPLARIELADYLGMAGGLRQYFASDGSLRFTDVSAVRLPMAEAAAAPGGALRDAGQTQAPLIRVSGSTFEPAAPVARADLAYAFVQALGLEALVAGWNEDVYVDYLDQRIPIADPETIPDGLRGYVQAALDLQILNARFEFVYPNGDPELVAYVEADQAVERADYAVTAGRFFDAYFGGLEYAGPQEAAKTGTPAATASVEVGEQPVSMTLDQNYPNPFNPSTTIRFTLSTSADVSLVVYDVTGREVARLEEGMREAGPHEVQWNAQGLASGTYLYRLHAGALVETRRMVLLK